MKKGLAAAFCACLVVLAGCGTMGTVPASDQPPVQAAGVDAQWEYFPDFTTLGLKMLAAPPRDLAGPVEIGLTTDLDISIVGYITDISTGKELPETLSAIHDGKTWRLIADFPAAGRYTLTLFGKLKSTAGTTYNALARTSFVVTGDPAASWVIFPGFKKHAISAVTIPAHDVPDEAQIVLSTTETLEFGWVFSSKTTGEYVSNAVNPAYAGQRVTFTVSFPDTGNYELQLACRPTGAGDDAWEAVAIARFAATVSATSFGAPEHWKVTPANFRKYGVAVVSSSPRAVTDEAGIVLTSKQKISLAYSFSNRTTGKDTRTMSDVVEISQNEAEQAVTLFFPESGEYELVLWAKGENDKDYSAQLARVSFTAAASPAPQVPENWTVSPRFKKYGLSVVSSSPREAGEELSIVLSVPEGWDGYVYMRDKEGTSSVQTIASDIVGKEQRITAVFPKTGEYTLSLSGKPATEKSSRTLATATFAAKVDESQSPYRLWRIGGRWPRLPVAQVQVVKETWAPFGEYPSYDEFRKGVLTEAFTLAAAQGNVLFAKGAALMFARDYGNDFTIDTLSGNLAKDLSVKASGASLVFPAGSPFVVAQKRAVGQLTKDAKLTLEGNTLLAPKGTRISLWESTIYEILPAGKPTFTVGGKVYELTGAVQVEAGAKEGSPLSVKIATAKDYAFKMGTTSFTLPAGSLVSFTKQSVTRVVFKKDAKAILAGAADTLHAGEGIAFDDKGAATKFIVEELE
jgi:hypothetical protein